MPSGRTLGQRGQAVASKTKATKSGVTKPKLILIGVLAVALVGVLYLQYGRSGDGSSAVQAPPTRRERPRARRSSPQQVRELAEPDKVARRPLRELRKWQTPDLAMVVSYDPFALPDAFPRPQSAEESAVAAAGDTSEAGQAEKAAALAQQEDAKRQELEKLRQQGTTIVVKGRDNKYVALIGDKELRVGDEINGFTIIAIDPKSGVDLVWQGQ
jgi:hypothetical protein